MQIQNVTLSQNNYSQKHNPNFTSIRRIKIEGLYKKYPEYARTLVEAFKNNPKAMDFCKKYDVDVVFHAKKLNKYAVKSTIDIFCDNMMSKSKIRKFFGKLTGYKREKVVNVTSTRRDFSFRRALEENTETLALRISHKDGGIMGYRGTLDIELNLADKKIQTDLGKKLKKVSGKEAKAADKAAKVQLKTDTSELQDSINDLIEKGS